MAESEINININIRNRFFLSKLQQKLLIPLADRQSNDGVRLLILVHDEARLRLSGDVLELPVFT